MKIKLKPIPLIISRPLNTKSKILNTPAVLFIVWLHMLIGCETSNRYAQQSSPLKSTIVFKDTAIVNTYLKTITTAQLKTHLRSIASDSTEGRLTGSQGHNAVCEYIRDYYEDIGVDALPALAGYYQIIPKSYLPSRINTSQNVVAYIKGQHYPEEYIIISGHSDHIGIKKGNIYNGADDNASGTSAILEIAEAFKLAVQHGHTPKRSLIFMHITGEENGLYGSRYYTENPAVPLSSTIANLNIDMIGRTDTRHNDDEKYVYLIGSNRISKQLDAIIQKANDAFTHLELDYTYNAPNDPNRYYYRSDHYNFATKGIPVVFFFNGIHADYHQPTDTEEKINYELLKKRTELIFSTAWYLANANQRLVRDHTD